MMKKIKVVVKNPADAPNTVQIEKSLQALQKLVGGYIEACYITKELNERNIACYANDEGKLQHLEPNFWICDKQDVICGTAVFVKVDEEGEDIDLEQEDISLIISAIDAGRMNAWERIYVHESIKASF